MNYQKKFSLIVAIIAKTRGIGYNNSLVWNLIKEDMKRFRYFTSHTEDENKRNAVIMGKNTRISMGDKDLPKRRNIILSRTLKPDGEKVFNSLDLAIESCDDSIENIFIIGGQQIYEEALKHKCCDKIYLTEVDLDRECDTFFPIIPDNFILKKEEHFVDKERGSDKNVNLVFKEYENIYDYQSEEYQYINLVKEILTKGEYKIGRNGGTYSLFGPQHYFDLSKGLPLLTTKRMFYRGVVEELLFFIRGDTDTKKLEEKLVNIWKGNTSKEFLEMRKLSYREGDMGPMYGWQWRHFGAKYEGCDKDYTGLGFDQLLELIRKLVNDPNNRRLLLTTYDPSKVSESVLAPCHGLTVQFYVRGGNTLDCKMTQRSVDVGLGYPFNITSYAIFMHIICKVTGLNPGILIMSLGDTHIYEQHKDKITRHYDRIPYKFPTLKITKEFNCLDDKENIEERIKFMENLSYEDFEISDYSYHTGIKMDMVA